MVWDEPEAREFEPRERPVARFRDVAARHGARQRGMLAFAPLRFSNHPVRLDGNETCGASGWWVHHRSGALDGSATGANEPFPDGPFFQVCLAVDPPLYRTEVCRSQW